MSSRRSDRINLEELAKQDPADVFDFLDGIDDEQAFDSDLGGDSDAEDNVPISSSTPSASGERKRKCTQITDWDSDDSVADPDYILEKEDRKNTDNNSSDNSSSDNSSSDNEEEETIPDAMSPPNSSKKSTNDNDYCWTRQPFLPHIFEAVSFVESSGPKIPFSESPLEIFLQIFGEDFLNTIVNESNRYANQKGNSLELTLEELKAFLGILIIMGFHSLPSLRLYWSSDQNFHFSRISNIMSLKRFLKILRFLHVSDNEAMPQRGDPNFDKLYKIRPMVSYLSNSFLNCYNPSRNLSVDESMVAFKGRTHLKQYMPLKPIKRGIKIWAIACAETGYLLNFSVYEGKKHSDEEGSLGEKTVLEISKPFQDKYYCLYFDNFFTSFPLLSKLLDRKQFADKNLQSGESDSVGTSNITVSKWKDRGKRCVLVASTMHKLDEKSTVKRMTKEGTRVTVECPKSIADYNQNMGGVDQFDQLHSCYNISWKSRRWWLKLFYYLTDASIVNSYVLYRSGLSQQSNSTPKTHLVFRSILANQLVGQFSSRKSQCSWLVVGKNKMKKVDGRAVTVENTVRINNVGDHLPIKTTSRRCAMCSTDKKPKRSNVACTKCEVALCIPCFAPFHNK